jgi:hypothetical protein
MHRDIPIGDLQVFLERPITTGIATHRPDGSTCATRAPSAASASPKRPRRFSMILRLEPGALRTWDYADDEEA